MKGKPQIGCPQAIFKKFTIFTIFKFFDNINVPQKLVKIVKQYLRKYMKGDMVDMFGFCIGKSRGYLTEFYGERVNGDLNRGVEEDMWWRLLC